MALLSRDLIKEILDVADEYSVAMRTLLARKAVITKELGWIAAPRYSEKLLMNARRGDAEAQFALAMIYRHRPLKGGTRNLANNNQEVIKWLTLAASQNHAQAQVDLAAFYFTGLTGVKKDMGLSYYWGQRALNNPSAKIAAANDDLVVTYPIGKTENFAVRMQPVVA